MQNVPAAPATATRLEFENQSSVWCQDPGKTFLQTVTGDALIGRRAMDRTHVLDVPHIGGAFHSGLLHRLTQFVRAHELARLLDAFPIQKQNDFARIVNRMKNAARGFAGMLAKVEVRIERLLPAAVIRHLVADQDMHHESASQIESSLSGYEISGRM